MFWLGAHRDSEHFVNMFIGRHDSAYKSLRYKNVFNDEFLLKFRYLRCNFGVEFAQYNIGVI